jgi:hypothetical protein
MENLFVVEQKAAPIEDPRAEQTVRRWRRAFLGIYLAFTAGAILIAFFSILAVHCGGRPAGIQGPRIREDGSDSRELRRCQADLDRLLRDLHREAFTVQSKALRFDTDPGSEWQNWSAAWRRRWQMLDYRCRFGALSGKASSPEIEKMASIHRTLDELQFAYGGLVARFAGTYVDRLRTLRAQLEDVRKMIDRRRPGPGTEPERPGATR